MLKRLQEYNLTLRFEKCQFGVPEVIWFGNVFSKQGMSPDPQKTCDIKEWKAPGDKSDVKSFPSDSSFLSAVYATRWWENLCSSHGSFEAAHS